MIGRTSRIKKFAARSTGVLRELAGRPWALADLMRNPEVGARLRQPIQPN